MNYNLVVDQLESNLEIFKSLFGKLGEDQYSWREAPEKWNLLEVLCHLVDEEKEDFRMRVKTTLETPGKTPPPIDPVGWVSEREYSKQNLHQKLEEFLNERELSVKWLRSLSNPAWNNHYVHPNFGDLSAHLFLSNWLAHDYIHIRQIIRIKRAMLKEVSGESLDYAGNW